MVQQARSVQLNADLNLGCCVSTTGGGCGMATEVACNSNAGTFLTGQCTEARCPEPEVRPCCHYSGKCEVTTENWCELSGGVWSTLGTDCGNAQCLSAICGFTVEKNRADQWYVCTAVYPGYTAVHCTAVYSGSRRDVSLPVAICAGSGSSYQFFCTLGLSITLSTCTCNLASGLKLSVLLARCAWRSFT